MYWYELWGVMGICSLIWIVLLNKLKKTNDGLIVRNTSLGIENSKLREELTKQCELFAETLKRIIK